MILKSRRLELPGREGGEWRLELPGREGGEWRLEMEPGARNSQRLWRQEEGQRGRAAADPQAHGDQVRGGLGALPWQSSG